MSEENQAFGFFEEVDNQAPSTSEPPAANTSAAKEPEQPVEEEETRYIFFEVSGHVFATPLLSTREVLEDQECRCVPNTTPYFLGVANVRGEVVGIVELGSMFNLDESTSTDPKAIIVFSTSSGTLGARVDRIVGVHPIAPGDIEKEPHLKSKFPHTYLKGIANTHLGLLSIIDLQRVLNEDDMVTIRNNLAA